MLLSDRANNKAIVYACDCCESALETAKELVSNAISSEAKCRFFPFHCDIATQSLPTWLHYSSCRNNSDVLLIEDGTNMNAPPPPNWNRKPFSCLDGVDIAMMVSDQNHYFDLLHMMLFTHFLVLVFVLSGNCGDLMNLIWTCI